MLEKELIPIYHVEKWRVGISGLNVHVDTRTCGYIDQPLNLV